VWWLENGRHEQRDIVGLERQFVLGFCTAEWRSARGCEEGAPNLRDVKSFRARTEANGKALMEVEIVNPDRFHWKVQSDKGGGEFLIIGKDTFIRKENSPWMKSPLSMSAMIQQMRDENVEEAMNRRDEIKFVGRDVVDGAPAFSTSTN